MRWRTSISADESAIDGGGGAPLDTLTKADVEQQHEAAPTSSSPLAQQNTDSISADSSLVASSLMAVATSSSGSGSVSPRHAIDLLEDSSSDSQANPDGDPPYKRRQQTALPDKDGDGAMDSNDEEDMPALEAVNPDDGDDDDDTGDDHEVPWKPQATQSTCEFTHTITNYSQKRDSGCKKAEYSATTVDEFGNRWRLIVYVNGNGRASNHHLSLFLQVADADYLPFGWKKAVSYVLTLEHNAGPNLSYAKRNPDKTFKLCPKAIDWGWSQFITSDRIQQEGFVQDDSLVVRASVTVKSSSVSIDLEDAELYLKCAVEEGKPEAVQLCLDQGASVNCQFKDDLYTPLHTACSTNTGDVDLDEDEDEDDDDSDTSGGHKRGRVAPAANSGSMKVLRLLLDKGADGNACNKWRETPLLIAANNGHRSAVEALLEHDADPSLCSEAGWSALTFAAHKGYDDIVELLLKAGAPVNCRVTEDASTPLHKACAGSKAGHLAAATLLLANNADVHALNKWRETPLLTAANHGQAGTVDALLKAGADPCKCTDTGWSPLSIAAYKGHDDVVKLLLEEGAPTEEADPTLSALLQAATKGLPDTVELLLRHGADHTVTTKKGDTALSILVEQNLIDAAADMVTEYNASIPRCSRDRKKVQRARLLVNLKIKQRQREGRDVQTVDTDDDESDAELDSFAPTALITESDDSVTIKAVAGSKNNKNRNSKKKISAEQQAKAAEEALLAELEMEDAERQKQEDEANKKSAKKRKKKERERQVKKEQEEKRMEEEKQRQDKVRKEQEAKDVKERAERDRVAAINLKEEEEERKRVIEKQKIEDAKREEERKREIDKWKQQQKLESAATAKGKHPVQGTSARAAKTQPVAVAPPLSSRVATPTRAAQPTKSTQGKVLGSSAKSSTKVAGKNRGWETKPAIAHGGVDYESRQTPPKPFGAQGSTTAAPVDFMTPSRDGSDPSPDSFRRSQSTPFSGFSEESMKQPAPGPISFTALEPILNGFTTSSPIRGKMVEVPAVALFRRNKLSELMQRIAATRATGEALGTIKESTIKKVLYRWMVRAVHESTQYLDCIIPSWTDSEKLTVFFQRQLISESRKRVNSSLGSSMVSIEALKEAGSTIAFLCQSLAKEVSDFCTLVDEQLPHDWNDAVVGMKVSEVVRNGSVNEVSVVLDWANRAQVFLPSVVFRKLQQRYAGHPSRLLTSIFSTQIRYETLQFVISDTLMDFRLPAETSAILIAKAQVSAEVWSNPMTATSGNVFWGQFFDVDEAFGGHAPFCSQESNDEILTRNGGSVVVIVPLDNMVASMYIHRLLDLLDRADSAMIGVSFVIFLRSECFLEGPANPSFNDLCLLEPRVRERADFFSYIKELPSRQHGYFCTKTNDIVSSETGSLLVVLQNASGRGLYGISEMMMGDLLRSMRATADISRISTDTSNLPLMSEMSFSAPEFVPASKAMSIGDDGGNNFFNHTQLHTQAPVSPVSTRSRSILPDFGGPMVGNDFGGFGSGSIGGAFGSAPVSRPSRPARGRLFDLVDDGGEDETADVVSGMLGNLNMDDLFSHQPNRNSSGEVDIEAISLMGIGGPTPSSSNGGLHPRRGPFGY